MANVIKLTCISSTASSNGGFILKLQNKDVQTIATPFGEKTQGKQQTYYMKVDGPCKVGLIAPLDLDQFKIVERVFDRPTEIEGVKEPVTLKWLQL
jgi:hypothetical protein